MLVFCLVLAAGGAGVYVYRGRLLHNQTALSKKNDTLKEQLKKEKADNKQLKKSKKETDEYNDELAKTIKETAKARKQEQVTTEAPTAASSLFPEMTANAKGKVASQEKVVYLTFDDGPSAYTQQVLDILDQYNAKATFFVVKVDNENTKFYKKIVDAGHTIGIHTATHDYNKIYASLENYITDFHDAYSWVEKQTGVKCSLFRFPGGSKNSYNQNVGPSLIQEMKARGFKYYDWNVSSGDGSSKATESSIISWVTKGVKNTSHPVVLMHDSQGHEETIKALPTIMKTLADEGYEFQALKYEMDPVQY